MQGISGHVDSVRDMGGNRISKERRKEKMDSTRNMGEKRRDISNTLVTD
jgi:hypothetical protein